ncbi:MAG: diguanylate cyclase [Thiobacillus sp.]|nr:diguanylate cyclase [Thiobacillus sp.]
MTGEYRWIMNVAAPYEDLNGDFAGFVGTCDDITERKRYESQLERQANYDDLTGLANRNLFQDRLSQVLIFARRKNRSLAVLFIDLDNFKNINDGLGHDAGDALLATRCWRWLPPVLSTTCAKATPWRARGATSLS